MRRVSRVVLWGGLACALTIGAAPAQFLNEIIRGAVNNVPVDMFNCGDPMTCDLGYRMWSTAVSPPEINGPANPVDGIPRYNRRFDRYQSDAQTTANFPGSSTQLNGNEWYIAWDGQTGGGTADHAGWYGLQAQKVEFSEIGNSFSFNCLPVIAQEACFAALENGSHGTSRADGSSLDPIGGLSPISCPSLSSNTLTSLAFDWNLLSNWTSRDGAFAGVTTDVYLYPNPSSAPTDADLDAAAVLVASLDNQAGIDTATLSKASLAATAGLEGSTIYSAALKLTYPGGLQSTYFSCNSELTGQSLLMGEAGDAPCAVDTEQVFLETTDDGFVVITLDQCTDQVSQNQIRYELFFDADLDGFADETIDIFGFPAAASRNKAGAPVLLRYNSTFDGGDVEGNSSLDNTSGRVQIVIDAAGLQAAVGSTFGLSGRVKRPGGNRDDWDAGVLSF